jgi:RNA polymerase sigma factor (sigma-70 family)
MIEPAGFQELVRLAQTGDLKAMERLLEIVRLHLESVAGRFVESGQPGESVSDLVQEGCMRVWERLHQFRGATSDEQAAATFHEWVGQIVGRVAANRREARHAQRRMPKQEPVPLDAVALSGASSQGAGIDPAGSGPTPSAIAAGHEQDHLVRQAILKIPNETDREIVRFYFFEGLSLRQIAERLGLSYDKVRERHHASLGFLERELGGLL